MTTLRSVKITFNCGDTICSSMASHLTDEEIKNYYKVGKIFNIGSGQKDRITTVKQVDILI